MACADACGGHIPTERPTLLSSWAVIGSLAGWVVTAVGIWAGAIHAREVSIAAYAVAIVSASFYFAREAVEELVEKREIGIELLMTLAIAGAAALGQWREAALVACLYSITEALEGFTIQRTRWAIRGLMDTVLPTAHLIRDGQETEVAVQDVKPGDLIRIRADEAVSVDGIVREGRSSIDESAITGESMPVERTHRRQGGRRYAQRNGRRGR